jgi:RNA polymerase sigma-70 factor (ECF subfamily)
MYSATYGPCRGGAWHATPLPEMSCTTLCLEASVMSEAKARLEAAGRSGLLTEARRGDGAAFTELVLPYAPGLYRRALRLTGNPADAEDARQEAMLKAFTRLEQFGGNSDDAQDDLHAWVSRITTNASIDLLRQRRNSKVISLEKDRYESGENFAERIAAREENPEERYARREMRSLLARAITQLPPDLRQVCLLRDILQYTTQEVAGRLGISTVAVRLRLFRAHRRLHEELRIVLRRNKRHSAAGRPASMRATQPRVERFLPLSVLPDCACGD